MTLLQSLKSKETVANSPSCWDEQDRPTYDPRKVEWWLAPDNQTILCGDPNDPEVVCRIVDEEPMSISNRPDNDTIATLTATHIVNLHNRGHA